MNNEFCLLIKEICKENGIECDVLSTGWILSLNKNGVRRFISGYKFDSNGHALGQILDDKFGTYELLRSCGIPVCEHNILYSNLTANEASQKEQELIKYYNTIENGYNCESGGLTNRKHSQETIEKLRQLNLGKNNPNYGKTASKETRLKLSQSHKNIPHSKEWTEKVAKAHRKRVLCITTGETFPSLKDAADKTGISISGISQACNGIRMTAGKHPVTKEKLKWKYI